MIHLKLFILFLRIGFFSFGGGYAMLPLIYQGAHDMIGMTAEEFSRLVAISQVTPGPVAINAATYVGYQTAGVIGATIATVGVVLPSLILVLIVVAFFKRFQESQNLTAVLTGIRPVTIGLLGSAVVFLAQGTIFHGWDLDFMTLVFALVIFGIFWRFKTDPILLTVLAGAAGAIIIR